MSENLEAPQARESQERNRQWRGDLEAMPNKKGGLAADGGREVYFEIAAR